MRAECVVGRQTTDSSPRVVKPELSGCRHERDTRALALKQLPSLEVCGMAIVAWIQNLIWLDSQPEQHLTEETTQSSRRNLELAVLLAIVFHLTCIWFVL